MSDEELEKLARMVAARVTPAAELLTEIGEDTKAAVTQLRNERTAMPEVTALAARLTSLEEEIETRLPRQPRPPRPWHPRWWGTAPPPAWWRADPKWWGTVRTATGALIAATIVTATWAWMTPFVTLNADYQYWVGIRLTWWL